MHTAPTEFPDTRFQPFQERRPLSYGIHGDELLADKEHALANFCDILGAEFFQGRDDICVQLLKLGEDGAFREKLGTVNAAKYEAFAALPPEHQAIAVDVAREAMNQLIRRVAQSIACDVRGFPGEYWVEWQIKAVLYKVLSIGESGPKLKKVATQAITGDPKGTLASSFGRWLNKFGVRRSADG
jgi:hypothetical protein